MKNTLVIFFAFGIMSSMSTFSYAQNDYYRSNVYVGTALSAKGILIELAGDLFLADEVNINSRPAIQANFDYGVTDRISIGGAVSYQQLNVAINGYRIPIDDVNFTIEDVTGRANLTAISIRGLYHYPTKDELDIYSGLRISGQFSSVDINTTDTNFNTDPFRFALPVGFQVIPVGVRYFVTDNIGVSFETAIGAPHFLSAGLNFRI